MTRYIKRTLALSAAISMMTSAAYALPFDTIDVTTDTPLSVYEKVYIAPVEVDFSEHRIRRNLRDTRGIRPVSERDQARKAVELAEDLERVFGKKYILVDAPGEDVLTVETTLTKLVSTRPTLADARNQIGLSFNSLYAGGADYQVQLIAGETLLTSIEERQSNQTNLNDGRPRVGIWADVNNSFNWFSRKLVKYVDNN